MTKEINTIDPSMGSAVDECARKFYFRYVRGVTPIWEPDYFISGRAWDAMLGEWRKDGTPSERYVAALSAMQAVYDTCRCEFFNERRTPENLTALFAYYIEWEEFQPPYKVLGSNLGFRFPYKDFFLGGELDAFLEWPPYGVVVDENKTTTIIPESKGWPRYEDGFSLGRYANQITHYLWACMQISEEVWGTRALIACLDIPKRPTTQRTLFQPLWLKRTQAQILDYLDLCEARMRKIRDCQARGVWPKEGQHCTGGWGFSRCEYAPLCQLPIHLEDIEVPLNLYRVGEPWAPWDGVKSSADIGEGKEEV